MTKRMHPVVPRRLGDAGRQAGHVPDVRVDGSADERPTVRIGEQEINGDRVATRITHGGVTLPGGNRSI